MSREHKGIHYYFVFWNNKENKWVLVNQRFIVGEYDNNLIGQYITSMWFNVEMDQEKQMAFMVFGVKNRQYRKHIIEQINRNNNDYPSINDLSYDSEFCELFQCNKDTTKKLVKNAKEKGNQKLIFNGVKNEENTLRMDFDYARDTFLTTLPEFKFYL